MLGVGIALALAVIVIGFGLVSQFVLLPNSTVATVGATTLVTKDFWKRTFLEQNRMVNQLQRYQQLEQQFGGQGFFTTQISQLQGTLSSPFSLGVQVLDQMIREEVVRQKAAEKGITVSQAEIDAALREEVANQGGFVSVAQATATVEAAVKATATATSWTPTPSPTVDASTTVTATATPIPTPAPPPTSTIITDDQYATGLKTLEDNLQSIAKMSLDDYRKVIEARLLDKKLSDSVSAELVPATEEEIHARHILLSITNPVTETNGISSTNEITAGLGLTPTTGLTETANVSNSAAASATAVPTAAATQVVTATQAQTATAAATSTAISAATTGVTTTKTVTTSAATTQTAAPVVSQVVTSSPEVTVTKPLTSSGALTTTESVTSSVPVSRNEAETLALALDIRRQLEAGADFATLAKQYSSDTGSAANGGDLGWFGHGKMVAPFEAAAFSLTVGAISQPVRTDYGYHIIQVLEKDPNHPKDENSLAQERSQAYEKWIQEQIAASKVTRSDLVSKLPSDLKAVVTQDTSAPSAPQAPQVPALPDTSGGQ